VGVYTKSKTSELSPLRRKLLRFAKQFPPPLRSNKKEAAGFEPRSDRTIDGCSNDSATKITLKK
jgi:hypothetical protein